MKETFIPRNRKLSNILALVLLGLIFLGGIFHFWFINNTEQFFENIVSTQSNGKVKLKVKSVSFNYFSRNVRLQQAEFFSEDTLSSTNSYRFNVADLKIKVKSVRALIFKQEILIDSLSLITPHVTITHLRHNELNEDDTSNVHQEFSIAREMGNIYRSIEDALNILQIRYFKIIEGRFSLVNALQPNDQPINITHIFLEVDNIAVNDAQKKDTAKFLFSDNIILRTHSQQIFFPGGRHKLSFGAFEMNVKDKKIEIDNCRVSGEKSDTSKVAFDMFFRKLQLLNFDFAALANDDLIKADSVYCQDPEFKLSLVLRSKGEARKNQPFQLDEVMRQVGSNMEIKFAGLSNANVEITTTRDNNPVVFSSEGNDLFLYDFSINNAAKKPIKMGGIDVAIRNYDMVTRDGSTAIKFDSIQLRNNTIRLNNFSLSPTNQVSNRNIRNIDVPLLQITGLSWETLLADRKIVAEKAVLHNPRISYKRINQAKSKQSFFHALAGIDEFMEVDQLELINGQFRLDLKEQKSFELENMNFSLRSNQFVSSQNIGHIERSIEQFNFSKGSIRLNNLNISLNDVKYAGRMEQLHAESVTVNDMDNESVAFLNDVYVTNLSINEALKKFSVDSVSWHEGDIYYLPTKIKKGVKQSTFEINIHNISGKNTRISTDLPSLKLNMNLHSVKADKLTVLSHEKPVFENLSFSGEQFSTQTKDLKMNVGNYTIRDEQPSTLQQVLVERNNPFDSLYFAIPSLKFTPSINSLLRNQYSFTTIEANKPVLHYSSQQRLANEDSSIFNLPSAFVENLRLLQPEIIFSNHSTDNSQQITMHGLKDKNSFLELTNIDSKAQNINIGQLSLQSNNLAFVNENKRWGVDTGKLRLSITGMGFSKTQNPSANWKALLQYAYFVNPIPFQLSDVSSVTLDSVQINNLDLGSGNKNLLQYLKNSPSLSVSRLTGKMEDTATLIRWYNGRYNHAQKFIELDSFNYRPLLDRDDYISSQPYQSDYLLAKTGSLTVSDIEIEKYLDDEVLVIGNIKADNANVSVFRNKLIPRKQITIKYLPTAALLKNAGRFNIDSINLTRSRITYTELSEKTKDTGTIYFTSLDVHSGPYTNLNIGNNDSLRIHAKGKLFDKGVLNLRFHQSYLDSLAGFELAMQAELEDASVVNQVLVPITQVKITSGTLDSLWLYATGNNYTARGEMKMLYNKLKVQIKKNDTEKASFGEKLSSFIANNFLIRSHNLQQKTGIIFFERWQDRSVFNYMVKILVSGISTSIGLKSNAKAIKEYELHIKTMSR